MYPTIHLTILRAVTIAIVALLLPLGYSPGAATAGSDGPSDVLQFRGNSDFSPYEFINDKNEPDGYNVELTQAIARQLGLKVHIELGQWSDVRRELETDKVDALIGVLYSKERDEVFDFSVPHVVISYAVFVRKDSTFQNPMDLMGKEVVVVKNVYAHDWMTQNDFTPHVVTVARPEEALQLLSQGRHDCAVLARLHGLDLLRSLNIDNLKTIGPPVLTQKMGFAVKAGNADLLAKINEGLYLVQASGEYDRIYRKWFSVYEQKRFQNRLVQIGKLLGLPLIALLVLAGLWIRSLKHLAARRTQTLKENQILLNRIAQGTPLPTLVRDRNGKLLLWNRACEELTGISAAAAAERAQNASPGEATADPFLLHLLTEKIPADSEGKRQPARPQFLKSSPDATELEVCVPQLGDAGCWLYGTIVRFCDEQGHPIGIIETWQDLTDRKNLEKQLVHSQRLEAMGRLAGAIAHDFTNFLQAILVFTETAKFEISADSPVRYHLDGIQKTVFRAKELIHQIKVFSRQNLLVPKAVRLKAVVQKAVASVKNIVPDTIVLRLSIDSDARIMADEVPIEQVVSNLCMNAVNAMGDTGGTLTVRLSTVELTRETAWRDPELRPGVYAKLTVADTGKGIPAEHLERIFEPFFTTRKREGGTGMGLAIVHGIVKGYDGVISVESEVGKGTAFEILWPVIQPEDDMTGSNQAMPQPAQAL
ncbi:MAG: transporter substrate-binding domain-containing protein [Desulfobacterales bacterium]|nr:transporter substrate-binding domain-containing protein [Desulfobacterales bacterium]